MLCPGSGPDNGSSSGISGVKRRSSAPDVRSSTSASSSRATALAAQLELATSELAVEDGQTKLHQALGALEDAVQRPLPTWPDLEHGRATQAQHGARPYGRGEVLEHCTDPHPRERRIGVVRVSAVYYQSPPLA